MAAAKKVGKVDHYYDKIGVAVVIVEGPISVGDELEFRDKDETPKFTQKVTSMQIEHEKVGKVKKGEDIGMKVDKEVKEGDLVYKL